MNEVIKEYSQNWKDVLYIIFGSFAISYSFQVFLFPNNIISGGVSSLSMIIHTVIGATPSIIQYAFNIPLLALSFILLGREVGVKSLLGSLLFPFFTGLVSNLEPITNDLFLASIFGGIIMGIGVGLVYKAKGSTGGTATVAQILSKYTSLTLGTSTLIADASILVLGIIIFDLESILYGIISIIILSYTIDIVLVGKGSDKNVLIISEKADQIQKEVLDKFDRGVTLFDVRGGYRNEPKEMLMVIINEREITAFQEMILQNDESAFVVVMSASEVMGRGFSLEKYFPTN